MKTTPDPASAITHVMEPVISHAAAVMTVGGGWGSRVVFARRLKGQARAGTELRSAVDSAPLSVVNSKQRSPSIHEP